MTPNEIIAAVCAVALGGWMSFDGVRALVVGDYVTPRSGPYAGRLGPWADVVRRMGTDPRGTRMKTGFVVLGVAWLAIATGLVLAGSGFVVPAIVLAVATLWYVPVGTVLAAVVLVALGATLLL